MMAQLWALGQRIYQFKPRLFLATIGLMVALSLSEGISLLAVIPLVSVSQGYLANNHWLSGLLHTLGLKQVSLGMALIIFIVLMSISAGLQRWQTVQTQTIQQQFTSHLTINLFQLLAQTRWCYWLTQTKADISHVVTGEIQRLSIGCYHLFQFIAAAIILVIYTSLSLIVAPSLTLLIIGGGALLFWGLTRLTRRTLQVGSQLSAILREVHFGLGEHLTGLREVKAYGFTQSHTEYLSQLCYQVEANHLAFSRLQSWLNFIYRLGAALFISLIIYLALYFLHISLTKLLMIVLLFARLWPRLVSLQTALQSLVLALPAYTSICKLEEEARHAEAPQLAPPLAAWSFSSLQLVDINFSYGQTPLIDKLNLTIKRGEFIGCIGRSGSGKSTLADLLAGLLTVNSGQILVNGQPLAEQLANWQQIIAYVPQDAFLFNASLRTNLCWAAPTPISDNEIWQALSIVQLRDKCMSFPQQLESLVGERGINLSGGERQRLVLARALLRRPQFLILDEATSALDPANEALIQEALLQLKGQLTLFVITHRPASLTHADRIQIMG